MSAVTEQPAAVILVSMATPLCTSSTVLPSVTCRQEACRHKITQQAVLSSGFTHWSSSAVSATDDELANVGLLMSVQHEARV